MKPYTNVTYFGMALDPTHIGTGGYRLGRVDNTIMREPSTDIPKIPGTSIEGNARYYAALMSKRPQCAGKEEHKEKCPDSNYKCPICVTFGYTDKLVPEDKPKSLHGMAQFGDARVLFFPVHSMIGPVWITCPSVLSEFEISETDPGHKIKTGPNVPNNKLNLGWLYLEKEGDFSIPNDKLKDIHQEIKDRVVLVSNKLFSQVINSNLEVRTSVAIDPRTGAAEEGALFTYEAIPRASVLWFDVVFNDPSNFGVDSSIDIKKVIETVENGLKLFKALGIGGMQTRGFGRLKILNLEGEDQNDR